MEMECSEIPHYITANDHGWMITINGIQTLLNIDEEGLDSHAFNETCAWWLDYNIHNKTNFLQNNALTCNHGNSCLQILVFKYLWR